MGGMVLATSLGPLATLFHSPHRVLLEIRHHGDEGAGASPHYRISITNQRKDPSSSLEKGRKILGFGAREYQQQLHHEVLRNHNPIKTFKNNPTTTHLHPFSHQIVAVGSMTTSVSSEQGLVDCDRRSLVWPLDLSFLVFRENLRESTNARCATKGLTRRVYSIMR